MIHFRLRRSLRHAVDLLSLNFAGSLVDPRFLPLAPRRSPASASAVPQPSAFPQLSRPAFPAIGSRRHHVRSIGRRYLASTGLLLALSLEVCGCNPVGDPDLSSDSIDLGLTGHQISRVEQALSFYDPVDQPASASSYPGQGGLYSDPRAVPVEARAAPWAIPESVYLIYRSRRPGELLPRQSPLASAFVLSVPGHPAHDQNGRSASYVARFLVTARHVVDPQWAQCSDRNPSTIELRLNRRTGGVGYETVSLQNRAGRRFFTPADPTADLAVIPLDNTLIANLEDYKVLDIPYRVLISVSDVAQLHPEQPVMTAGLSSLPNEEPVSFPVFDAGSLSKMPAETVGVRCGEAESKVRQSAARLLHVWFINAGLPQGVSGAPVFASIARGADSAKTPVLLGVQSVVWPNRGMVGITPSPMLGDLIQSALRDSGRTLSLGKGSP